MSVPAANNASITNKVDDATNVDESPVDDVLKKAANDERSRQLDPEHIQTGPGRPAGYKGKGDKADLDNHSVQLQPEKVAEK